MNNYQDAKLCRLIRKGVPEKDPEGFASLIREARFFCRKCGAVSKDKKCLCRPWKLDP
ncbi:MAG: hypothetical protein JXA95_11755 [Spirochaetales bacterium]|nr:hypothetical protein [Spirochaetales bacterium]